MDSASAAETAEPGKSDAAVTQAVEVAVVGEKRSAVEEDGGGGEGGGVGVQRKRMRSGGGYEAEMRRIAEIVLVLSAMGAMRGGREPTAAEKEMMAEARRKVVAICEDLAPKDIMPREVFGGIIEDLGLNRLKEQKLGFRPPKLSIIEKMEISKRRMGESKSFSAQAAVDSTQRAQTGVLVANENRGMATAARPFLSDKASHMPAGSFQHASPIGHVSSSTSTILSFQQPSSQVTVPVISTGMPNSNLGRDSSSATAKVERPHLRSDSRANGPSQASQLPAGFVVKTTTALQPQMSNISARNKLPDHPPVKMEVNAKLHAPLNSQATHVQTFNSVMNQAVPGTLPSMHHPIQGMHFVNAAPLLNHHLEISKIVQKILHPKPAERPNWSPPSKDYMSKSLTCQMCKLTINEVDNMLVCDACEKGFHLKCLQSCSQKFVPRGEWYCPRCMTICGGKPFPPKYGRVTRNLVATKITSNNAGVQSPSEKKAEAHIQNANQKKIVTNGKPDDRNTPPMRIAVESSEVKDVQRNKMHGGEVPGAVKNEEAPSSESCPDKEQSSKGASCVTPPVGSLANTHAHYVLKPEGSDSEDKVKTEAEVCTSADPPGSNTSDHLHLSNSRSNVDGAGALNDVGVLTEQNNDGNRSNNHSEKSEGGKIDDCNLTCDVKQNDHDEGQEKQIGAAEANTELQSSAKGSKDMHDINWIGDVHEVVDNKKFYQSCRINDVVYRLHDYALVRSSNGKLVPWKLQAMWEDSRTGSRWIAVNRCYFPGDLPETVGRPSAPEGNEVYESNDETTLMAGLIEGPCDVLPAKVFGETNQRDDQENGGVRPIFSCRWFYDKFKGVFCPIPR